MSKINVLTRRATRLVKSDWIKGNSRDKLMESRDSLGWDIQLRMSSKLETHCLYSLSTLQYSRKGRHEMWDVLDEMHSISL